MRSFLNIPAGQTTKIYLNNAPSNRDAKIITRAADEQNFFNHVTLKDFNTQGVVSTIEKSGSYKYISVSVPNMVSGDSYTLSLQYKYKGADKTFSFEIKLEPNVQFESYDEEDVKDNDDIAVPGIDTIDNYNVYKIALASNASYQIIDIINTYFNTEII